MMVGEVVAEMVGKVMVDGDGGRGTLESTLPPLSPTPIFAPDTSIRLYTYSSPDTFIRPHTYPSLDTSICPHTYPSPTTFIPP